MTAVHPSTTGKRFYKPVCKNGHEKRVVGVGKNNGCLACHKDRQNLRRREGSIESMSPFCKHGHEKAVVGTTRANECAEWNRVRAREQKRRMRAERYGVPVSWVREDADGLRVREVREGLGLSRPRLAVLAGLPYHTLAHIELGYWKGQPDTRKKIVDAVATVIADRNRRLKNLRRS